MGEAILLRKHSLLGAACRLSKHVSVNHTKLRAVFRARCTCQIEMDFHMTAFDSRDIAADLADQLLVLSAMHEMMRQAPFDTREMVELCIETVERCQALTVALLQARSGDMAQVGTNEAEATIHLWRH